MRAQPVKPTSDRPGVQPQPPGNFEPGKSLLTIEQVGKQLQVSRYTIWRLCRDGKFASPVKIGSRRRWRQQDIDAFTAEQRA